ncbi:hypothetical protein PV325_013923, partial [Microctonus aethiopoides]
MRSWSHIVVLQERRAITIVTCTSMLVRTAAFKGRVRRAREEDEAEEGGGGEDEYENMWKRIRKGVQDDTRIP